MGIKIELPTTKLPCGLCGQSESQCEGEDFAGCNGIVYLGNALKGTPLYFGAGPKAPHGLEIIDRNADRCLLEILARTNEEDAGTEGREDADDDAKHDPDDPDNAHVGQSADIETMTFNSSPGA